MLPPPAPLRLRSAVPALAFAVIIAGAVLLLPDPASAHTPHDTTAGIEISPSFASDDTVFARVDGRLLRSTDGGVTWHAIVNGFYSRQITEMEISEADPSRAYAVAAYGGIYRSADGGLSWQQANNGLGWVVVSLLSASPVDPDLAFAMEVLTGLHRTTDGGATWAPVPGLGQIVAMAFLRDGTGRFVTVDTTGQVQVSDDGGASWTPTAVLSGQGTVSSITASSDPLNPSMILVGTDQGAVLRSLDGGVTFSALAGSPAPQQVTSIVISVAYQTDTTLWASTWNGVYRSTDGGTTWSPADDGLTDDPQADTLGFPHFMRLSVGIDAAGDQVLFLAGFDGVFRSDDLADTWTSLETLDDQIVGFAVSPDYLDDSTVITTTYVKGAYLSTDSGESWTGKHVGLGVPIGPGNKYLPIRRLHNVAFSPDYANDATIFSAIWPRFLKSTDSAASWQQIPVGSNPSGETLRQLVLAVSPGYAVDRTVFAGTRQGEIYRSTGAGEEGTWTLLATLGSRVRSVVISPDFASDAVVWAGTVDGVFKSTDGGLTWSATGPPGESQLAISPGYGTDGTVFAGNQGGLFVTRDGGQTWTQSSDIPSRFVAALAVSPEFASDGTALVSVMGDGLFKTTDGGTSFVAIANQLITDNRLIADFGNSSSSALHFSPAFGTDQTVFGYAADEVLRSTDGGATWAVLPLPPSTDLLQPPEIARAPAVSTIAEGDNGSTFIEVAFDLSHPTVAEVRVDWSTHDVPGDESVASSADGDYLAASGTLVFASGDTSKTVTVEVLGDELDEYDEEVVITLGNPVGATIGGSGDGVGIIVDDDTPPVIIPGGVAGFEGDVGATVFEVPVRLSAPSGRTISVEWSTIDSTVEPTVGVDFDAASGTLTFAPGATTATASVLVHGDLLDEPGQLWGADWGAIALTSQTNAMWGTGWFRQIGLFLIVDDDP